MIKILMYNYSIIPTARGIMTQINKNENNFYLLIAYQYIILFIANIKFYK